jgi:Leucine Rich repeat
MTDNANTAEPQKPRRRWFQFSLRTLLILVVVVGVAGGWLGRVIERSLKAQEAADEHMKALLASEVIAVKIQSATGAFAIPCDRLKSPNDIHVNFRRAKAADSALLAIASHPQVGELVLEGTDLTDAGMKHISAFQNLQKLDVSGTKITDAGVKNLAGLTHLRFLDLDRTQVTNVGLKNIENLKQLEILSLYKTAITDDGLKSLKGLSQLDELYIDGTKVPDAGVADLQKALPTCTIYH